MFGCQDISVKVSRPWSEKWSWLLFQMWNYASPAVNYNHCFGSSDHLFAQFRWFRTCIACVGNSESYLLEQRATYQKLNSKSLCCFYGLARLLEWRNAIAIKSKKSKNKKWKCFQKYEVESSLCQQQSVESASKQMQIGSMRALDCIGITSDWCKKCLHLKRVELGSYSFTSICLHLMLFCRQGVARHLVLGQFG